jgi:hypothetical protein
MGFEFLFTYIPKLGSISSENLKLFCSVFSMSQFSLGDRLANMSHSNWANQILLGQSVKLDYNFGSALSKIGRK